jgi:glutamine synthetase
MTQHLPSIPSSLRHIAVERDQDSPLYLAQFTGGTADISPGAVLRRVLARAESMGLIPEVGIELEFTLFDKTPRSLAAKGYEGLGTATVHPGHDLILYQTAQAEFYFEVAEICGPLGIGLDNMHEEIAGGFVVACIAATSALEAADQGALFKNFIRVLGFVGIKPSVSCRAGAKRPTASPRTSICRSPMPTRRPCSGRPGRRAG